VPHTTVDSADSASETVRAAGTTAFGTRVTGACLLPRRLTVSDTGRSGTDSRTHSGTAGTDSGTRFQHRTPAPGSDPVTP